jgi:hypothetical protein
MALYPYLLCKGISQHAAEALLQEPGELGLCPQGSASSPWPACPKLSGMLELEQQHAP